RPLAPSSCVSTISTVPALSCCARTLPFHEYSWPLAKPSTAMYQATLVCRSRTVSDAASARARNVSGSDRFTAPDLVGFLAGFLAFAFGDFPLIRAPFGATPEDTVV